MFLATALLYPLVLSALCVGAGLLIDRSTGRWLPAALLPAVGLGGLIGLSQLTTLIAPLARATPYALAAAGAAGLLLSRDRLAGLCRSIPRQWGEVLGAALVYALALAPVLVAGRASFSSYMALADSAVHMLGADFILRHGQSYAHLDLGNSYGQFVNAYYNTSYPSGADTLFGGSSLLIGRPLIWTFQPFNAFVLATAYGPALTIARRLGLRSGWALLAALTAVVPALVYAYELFGSVKEITALPMILTAGALVVLHRRWLRAGPAGGVPLALVLSAGVSALGVAFSVWALVAVAVLAVVLAGELSSRAITPAAAAALVGTAAITGLVAALPTWIDLGGSLHVASEIASTSNSGNLHAPLRAIQALGIWLNGSYKLAPAGRSLTITHVLAAVLAAAAVLGAVRVLRIRAYALAGWLGLTLLAWLIVSRAVATWAEAKTLMLTSPAIVLLAWGGVAALRELRWGRLGLAAAVALAAAISGGVLVSDELQYRSSDLAPTARYEELAAINSRFRGRGPALFTDFDEYSLYVLRDLDVGGPDFVYPPPALASAAGGYGQPVDLEGVAPAALVPYPLIITRREPGRPRPPAAYRLAWEGSYYRVWSRLPDAPPALVHVALAGPPAAQCARIGALAASATGAGERLVAAEAPQVLRVNLAATVRPRGWGRGRSGIVMRTPGRLSADFDIPAAGSWRMWVQGEIMPTVEIAVDGRSVGSIGGELSGNSLVANTAPPLSLSLAAGSHQVSVSRPAYDLAPGSRGSADLHAILLTPSSRAPGAPPRSVAASRWRALCGRSYSWVELTRGS